MERETSVLRVVVPAEYGTENLTNASPQHKDYTNLLGNNSIFLVRRRHIHQK
jgi:hypothetical protein